MKILITAPSLKFPHGGIRVILEWCRGLNNIGHTITLLVNDGLVECDWCQLPESLHITVNEEMVRFQDCIIISNPHGIHLQDKIRKDQKCFLFMQMAEHLFDSNQQWQSLCRRFYLSRHPIICISKWNIEMLENEYKRIDKIHYIGNGINLQHFPIESKINREKIVLIEGWECTNPTKDIENIGPKVAAKLLLEGFKVIAYSGKRRVAGRKLNVEYHRKPNLTILNDIYRRAAIMVKVTKFDARSCAPIEAMTKGTPTVRGIIKGDDDLISSVNSIRCGYDVDEVFNNVVSLWENVAIYNKLSQNCIDYVKKNTWDYWIEKINMIINE